MSMWLTIKQQKYTFEKQMETSKTNNININ